MPRFRKNQEGQKAGIPLLEAGKRNLFPLSFLSVAWELGTFLCLFVGFCPNIFRLYYLFKAHFQSLSEKHLFVSL